MRRALVSTSFAFTLVEWLVTMTILAMVVTLAAQVCNGARWIQCNGNRRLDVDEEARAVFDRMAMDFAQLARRPDVDYWLKEYWNSQPGNDALAFFSSVPGYYPEDSWNSPVSVIGYWVDPAVGLRRYSCGLLWNGMARTDPQLVFSGSSVGSTASGSNTLARYWPEAVWGSEDGSEPAGPEVFRMEYYYILRSNGTLPPLLSAVPWDARVGHSSLAGLRDVAAIGVVVALLDARSRAAVSQDALTILSGSMEGFSSKFATPGMLETQWESAVRASSLPRGISSSIRIYRRWFYLSPAPFRTP